MIELLHDIYMPKCTKTLGTILILYILCDAGFISWLYWGYMSQGAEFGLVSILTRSWEDGMGVCWAVANTMHHDVSNTLRLRRLQRLQRPPGALRVWV